MSRERIATMAGLLLLATLLSGCGGGSGGTSQAPVATDQPDGGLEASKKIMDMPPPPPRPGRGK